MKRIFEIIGIFYLFKHFSWLMIPLAFLLPDDSKAMRNDVIFGIFLLCILLAMIIAGVVMAIPV